MTLDIDRSADAVHAQRKTALLTSLFGFIPLSIGRKLRQSVYQSLFGTMGTEVKIDPGLELINASNIYLGNRVLLSRNVCFNAWNSESKILIHDGVHLDYSVHLKSLGGYIEVGKATYIGPYSCMTGPGNITIDKNCLIASHCNVCASDYDFSGSHALVKGKILIHEGAHIDHGVYLQSLGGCIEVGEMTYIGPYVCMAGPGNITIGKNCLIASHSSAYANNHIFSDPHISIDSQGVTCESIVIEDDCWLGTGVRVLDGVTIGKGSIIGAGAVVTKSLPPYSIAVGVPAKVIRQRSAD